MKIFGYRAKTWFAASLLLTFLSAGCGSTGVGSKTSNSSSPPPGGSAASGVFTRHYNTARTGANTAETTLTPANVGSSSFGLLFTDPIDGFAIAQPLYVANVAIAGQGTHNVVYVATENNTVYAFDADKQMSPLWQTSMNPSGGEAVPCTDIGQAACVAPTLGVTATPVIDPATNTMYVEARSKQNGGYSHHLHALDITSGAERQGSPVTITASVPGTADGGSTVNFNPLSQNSRPALLLLNGVVYVSFGSLADLLQFHGWIMGYDANSLNQVSVFCTDPNGDDGSIWHSAGLASDGTSIFAVVGNGDFNPTVGDYGDTALKLSAQLAIQDSFTPFNQDELDSTDSDLGSGGPLLLPDEAGSSANPHLMIFAGKEGRIYLVNRDHMGGYNSTADQVVQELVGQLGGGTGGCAQLPHCSGTDVNFSTPAYWNGKVYFAAMNDVLKSFTISSGALSPTPFQASNVGTGVLGYPPTVSANGTSNGIVWVLDFENGFLLAFDANNLATQLFSAPLNVTEFSEPVVFNGKVYAGTQFDLSVFGLH
ncbi:MAG: PQQ-binding-like beta-propeller repeat protein [Acidobacteria bacterium]|nr:PQQ-binding-like beta-propeller repeat protein [Acidobacteriota bacterium]